MSMLKGGNKNYDLKNQKDKKINKDDKKKIEHDSKP